MITPAPYQPITPTPQPITYTPAPAPYEPYSFGQAFMGTGSVTLPSGTGGVGFEIGFETPEYTTPYTPLEGLAGIGYTSPIHIGTEVTSSTLQELRSAEQEAIFTFSTQQSIATQTAYESTLAQVYPTASGSFKSMGIEPQIGQTVKVLIGNDAGYVGVITSSRFVNREVAGGTEENPKFESVLSYYLDGLSNQFTASEIGPA